jgi:serine/threonine-protein kinase
VSYERGTMIAGKYRVERVIGEGGMGVVLAARHLGLDEMVAVKLIREERAAGPGALARFQREARASARIKSEHVARVLDVDRLPDGAPYIVMELIDGTDLHALVRRRGPLPPEDAATYIVQSCEGLAEAHALGMVHRDLKLKNLFLTKRRDGRPLIKVIDFGVVKLSAIADESEGTLRLGVSDELALTRTAMLVGSVHYMAPEQIRAPNVVDARADVWSLGVCLYTLLTGELPFEGENIAAVCAAIRGRPVPDVRELAPHVPAELAAIVRGALEKDVGRRFASVAELAHSLGSFGVDPAAPSRIEAILHSDGVEGRALYRVHASSEIELSTLSDNDSVSRANVRAESTIDAAAVGSLAPQPTARASTSRRRLTGALVFLGGATLTMALWFLPTRTVPPVSNRGATVAPPATVPLVDPTSTAADPTTTTRPTVTATATAVGTSLASAAASLAATPRAPVKRLLRPPKVQTTVAPPAPRSEPSSAYDHF